MGGEAPRRRTGGGEWGQLMGRTGVKVRVQAGFNNLLLTTIFARLAMAFHCRWNPGARRRVLPLMHEQFWHSWQRLAVLSTISIFTRGTRALPSHHRWLSNGSVSTAIQFEPTFMAY
ncbi:hypothetical protein M406DRAFT_103758 [Cryphonectria parasitica EP155]|uniref:Uncharacterized protein n=1 Tax=Cryphonectria parasitica (strain ATCC 38755 / EP155) TaxID=660469 RepID=A0A9P4XYM6_CRYP1|nr:uncharacterized protein M406DRAFT_103758 [Cryphonectria parasitica EP155]KAF3763316.1 hypothetical protein M406DRAFT_103758 [Cryphonectria parasitica EP155]